MVVYGRRRQPLWVQAMRVIQAGDLGVLRQINVRTLVPDGTGQMLWRSPTLSIHQRETRRS
jgi:hypothetical protein